MSKSMLKLNIQFFGGRGASGKMSEGPQGGGGNGKTQWGQPNTPLVVPAPTIEMQIGKAGKPVAAETAIKYINPDRKIEYGDYSMNCQRCVVAFELNRRGYKVEASESYEKDPYPKNGKWMDAFKGATTTNVGASSTNAVNTKITNNMQQWGDNSRAIVRVRYNGSSGHVFNVEYKNGKLHYYDAQTGERYNPKTVFNHVIKSKVQIVRVDNLPITDDVKNMVRKRR